MYVYDSYTEGTTYGTDDFFVSDEVVANWLATYPGDAAGEQAPVGAVVLFQQQAYKRVITPRPPGHVQGGQEFTIVGPIPVRATVRTEVSCVSKEIRKERRWVRMGFRGKVDGRLVYTGINTILVPM